MPKPTLHWVLRARVGKYVGAGEPSSALMIILLPDLEVRQFFSVGQLRSMRL
jgi:hypothetical protein